MIIISPVFLRLFTNNFAKGIALFPFIILNDNSLRVNKRIITHERIHLCQQAELLIIPFYFWYLMEFFFHFLNKRSFRLAYESISFEKEAHANDENNLYLKQRKFMAFLKYL